MKRIDLSYDEYRRESLDGDVLEWEPRPLRPGGTVIDPISEAIAEETGGPYCHASIVLRVLGRPMQFGYHYPRPFATALSREVRDYSGRIAVYRVKQSNPHTRSVVADAIVDGIGGIYLLENIRLIWLEKHARFLQSWPVVGPFVKGRIEAQSRKRSSGVCHEYVRRCWKPTGIDLLPGVAMALGSPNALARSPNLEYLGHLVWPNRWGAK